MYISNDNKQIITRTLKKKKQITEIKEVSLIMEENKEMVHTLQETSDYSSYVYAIIALFLAIMYYYFM